MTDEQIINALKKYIECAEGTQIARDVGGTLVISLLQNALDLINRQQAEIEKLKAGIEEEHSISQSYSDLCDYKQKEIERLKEEVASKSLKCNLLEQEKAKNISSFVDDLKLVRAEAIKELEAKIHEKLHEAEMHGNFEPVVTREMFDSVVKELVGEGK